MQIEHKTEKGTVCFVKVPEDAIAFNFYMGYLTYKVYNPKAICNDDILSSPYRLAKFLGKTENISEYIDGNPIRFDENFTLIGLSKDINEEFAKKLVDNPIIDFGHDHDCFKDYIKECWTIETDSGLNSFKSLMHHLQVYEVNPFDNYECENHWCDNGYIDMGYNEKMRCQFCQENEDKQDEAEPMVGQWIVLFNPNKNF